MDSHFLPGFHLVMLPIMHISVQFVWRWREFVVSCSKNVPLLSMLCVCVCVWMVEKIVNRREFGIVFFPEENSLQLKSKHLFWELSTQLKKYASTKQEYGIIGFSLRFHRVFGTRSSDVRNVFVIYLVEIVKTTH